MESRLGSNFQPNENQLLDLELDLVGAAAVALVVEVEATVVLNCSLLVVLAAFVVLDDDDDDDDDEDDEVVVCTALSDPSSLAPFSVVSSKLDEWLDSVS